MEDRLVLRSSEPLENRLLKWRNLYKVAIVLLLLGFVNVSFFALAALYLMICYTIVDGVTRTKRDALRQVKFKFVPNIAYEDVFSILQPALLSKYGNSFIIERDKNGGITISYDGMIYDVILEEDYFLLHWRMSVGKAFLSINEYKIYRKALIAMGIIGYEIQSAYGIS